MSANQSRRVTSATLAVEQAEGAGARVRRSIGTPGLRNFTPFLMLDHFSVPKGAGFPDHPHRGMITITYMLRGRFQHEDSKGHAGIIGPGDLQFMTAARGIVHAEMPLQEAGDDEPSGLQLWVDLPAEKKKDEPDYQELKAADIPTAHPSSDVAITVISGEAQGSESEGLVVSPVHSKAPCHYHDIKLSKKGATVFQPIPAAWNAFVYILSGSVIIGDSAPQKPFHTVVLTSHASQNGVEITSTSDEEARFVLISGQPLHQPIIQYGPFVLTNEKDVRQAFSDYRSAKNGFEGADTWRSKIGAPLVG